MHLCSLIVSVGEEAPQWAETRGARRRRAAFFRLRPAVTLTPPPPEQINVPPLD